MGCLLNAVMTSANINFYLHSRFTFTYMIIVVSVLFHSAIIAFKHFNLNKIPSTFGSTNVSSSAACWYEASHADGRHNKSINNWTLLCACRSTNVPVTINTRVGADAFIWPRWVTLHASPQIWRTAGRAGAPHVRCPRFTRHVELWSSCRRVLPTLIGAHVI